MVPRRSGPGTTCPAWSAATARRPAPRSIRRMRDGGDPAFPRQCDMATDKQSPHVGANQHATWQFARRRARGAHVDLWTARSTSSRFHNPGRTWAQPTSSTSATPSRAPFSGDSFESRAESTRVRSFRVPAHRRGKEAARSWSSQRATCLLVAVVRPRERWLVGRCVALMWALACLSRGALMRRVLRRALNEPTSGMRTKATKTTALVAFRRFLLDARSTPFEVASTMCELIRCRWSRREVCARDRGAGAIPSTNVDIVQQRAIHGAEKPRARSRSREQRGG